MFLQLPIHKAVVVSLKDSDDSDSDVDNCSSAPMGFGGLEFMIKEARRTAEVRIPGMTRPRQRAAAVEPAGEQSSGSPPEAPFLLFNAANWESCVFQAAKPKAASASEKENNPVRTPEALPEDKKVEYRLLREQIAR